MASLIHNRYISTQFDWIINDFSKVNSEEGLSSEVFSVGDFEWQVQIYPKGYGKVYEHLSVYLIPVDFNTPVPEFRASILNLLHHNESFNKDSNCGWGLPKLEEKIFEDYIVGWGFPKLIRLNKLHNPDKGYIVNDTCVLRVEVLCRRIDDVLLREEYVKESNPENLIKQLVEYPGAGKPFGEGQNNWKAGFDADMQEYEDIGGFHVLKTQAILYTKIWLKYGHIPSTNVLPMASYPTLVIVVKDLMSSITEMYKCLYVELSSEMIEKWEHKITMAEKLDFNIGWLRERFEHVKTGMGEMQNFKTELQEHGQDLRSRKSNMRMLRGALTNFEVKLIAEKGRVREKISGLFSESVTESYINIGEDTLLDGLVDGVY